MGWGGWATPQLANGGGGGGGGHAFGDTGNLDALVFLSADTSGVLVEPDSSIVGLGLGIREGDDSNYVGLAARKLYAKDGTEWTEEWADGNMNYDNIWANRETLNYKLLS